MAQNVFFAPVVGDLKSESKTQTNGERNAEEDVDTDEEELEKSLISYEQFDNRWRFNLLIALVGVLAMVVVLLSRVEASLDKMKIWGMWSLINGLIGLLWYLW